MNEFKNKVLVVTGAGSGIGAAIAKEGALGGMKIVLCDIDKNGVNRTQDEIKVFSGESVALTADVSLLENVQKLYDLSMDTYGQVDIRMRSQRKAGHGRNPD
jgi:NADP-dependent 3-hydroxy acid dehydrogenase YdfG